MSDHPKHPPDFPDDLMPQNEAADDLDVKETTLATWRSTGKGPDFWKWGRAIFYSRAVNAAWKANTAASRARLLSEAFPRRPAAGAVRLSVTTDNWGSSGTKRARLSPETNGPALTVQSRRL